MGAAVSPGNSGGGRLNSNGEWSDIVNAKSSGDDAEGLGFVNPINDAIHTLESLLGQTQAA